MLMRALLSGGVTKDTLDLLVGGDQDDDRASTIDSPRNITCT